MRWPCLHLCACMCVCVCVCIYIYIYIYIYIWRGSVCIPSICYLEIMSRRGSSASLMSDMHVYIYIYTYMHHSWFIYIYTHTRQPRPSIYEQKTQVLTFRWRRKHVGTVPSTWNQGRSNGVVAAILHHALANCRFLEIFSLRACVCVCVCACVRKRERVCVVFVGAQVFPQSDLCWFVCVHDMCAYMHAREIFVCTTCGYIPTMHVLESLFRFSVLKFIKLSIH
jgi:hypothetical protein